MLDDKEKSLWCGSEIEAGDPPCETCGGCYLHAKDCPEDTAIKVKRQSNWHMATQEYEVCQMCFAKGGHRVSCPTRLGKSVHVMPPPPVCTKCGAEKNNMHNENTCLIRQATNRIKAAKEVGVPCDKCAGVLTHHYPCTDRGFVKES